MEDYASLNNLLNGRKPMEKEKPARRGSLWGMLRQLASFLGKKKMKKGEKKLLTIVFLRVKIEVRKGLKPLKTKEQIGQVEKTKTFTIDELANIEWCIESKIEEIERIKQELILKNRDFSPSDKMLNELYLLKAKI